MSCSYERYSGFCKNLGKVTKEDRSKLAKGISGIQIDGIGKVFIKQGDQESLTIEANENLLPQIITEINHGTIQLGIQGCCVGKITLNYYITLRNLKNISSNGSCEINVDKGFKSDKFDVKANGSSKVCIESLTATDFYANINGSSKFILKDATFSNLSLNVNGSGNVTMTDLSVKEINSKTEGSGFVTLSGKKESPVIDNQIIKASGSSHYDAETLKSKNSEVHVSGSAHAQICSQNLSQDSTAYGSGAITLNGKRVRFLL